MKWHDRGLDAASNDEQCEQAIERSRRCLPVEKTTGRKCERAGHRPRPNHSRGEQQPASQRVGQVTPGASQRFGLLLVCDQWESGQRQELVEQEKGQ